MADLPVAEQTLVGRVTGGHVDDLPFATVTESLGLGKYVAVGFNGAPTWIDPAAADWADVVANGFGWVQFAFNGSNQFDLYTGTGDPATNCVFDIESSAGSVQFIAYNPAGSGVIEFSINSSTAELSVSPNAGQTQPVLDVGVLQIAPDGKVGGTTPSVGDQLTWDGSKIVWAAP